MACRDLKRAEQARDKLWSEYANEDPSDPLRNDVSRLTVEIVDVSLLASVSAFCTRLSTLPRIDLLFCNAGIMPNDGISYLNLKNILIYPKWTFETGGMIVKEKRGLVTEEGKGEVFMANVGGHWKMVGSRLKCEGEDLQLILVLRTTFLAPSACFCFLVVLDVAHYASDQKINLLSPLFAKSTDPRIVWTSSTNAHPTTLSLSDIQNTSGSFPYASSKRLLDLVSLGLNRKWRAEGSPQRSYDVCPGNLPSGLLRSTMPGWLYDYGYVIAWHLSKRIGVSGNHTKDHTSAGAVYYCGVAPRDGLDEERKYKSETTGGDKWFVGDLGKVEESEGEVDAVMKEMEALLGESRRD